MRRRKGRKQKEGECEVREGEGECMKEKREDWKEGEGQKRKKQRGCQRNKVNTNLVVMR